MRQANLRKQTSLFILFSVPWLITIVLSITIQLINQLPVSSKGAWLYHLSDLTRYIYICEPILILSMVKQIREHLKKKLLGWKTGTVNTVFTVTQEISRRRSLHPTSEVLTLNTVGYDCNEVIWFTIVYLFSADVFQS